MTQLRPAEDVAREWLATMSDSDGRIRLSDAINNVLTRLLRARDAEVWRAACEAQREADQRITGGEFWFESPLVEQPK